MIVHLWIVYLYCMSYSNFLGVCMHVKACAFCGYCICPMTWEMLGLSRIFKNETMHRGLSCVEMPFDNPLWILWRFEPKSKTVIMAEAREKCIRIWQWFEHFYWSNQLTVEWAQFVHIKPSDLFCQVIHCAKNFQKLGTYFCIVYCTVLLTLAVVLDLTLRFNPWDSNGGLNTFLWSRYIYF